MSSTDPSEPRFSEHEVQKCTKSTLLAHFPGTEAQLDGVRNLWESTARDTLEKLLTDVDDLFMKYKADIGKCKKAKQLLEVEPGAVLHRKDARRMSREGRTC